MSLPAPSPALPHAASIKVASWKIRSLLINETVALLSPVGSSRLLLAVAIMVFRRT